MSRSLQAYLGDIEFPPVTDRAWIDGPFIGLETIREAIASLPPIFGREEAESALATTELMTAVEHTEATAALDGLWADFANFRGRKP